MPLLEGALVGWPETEFLGGETSFRFGPWARYDSINLVDALFLVPSFPKPLDFCGPLNEWALLDLLSERVPPADS